MEMDDWSKTPETRRITQVAFFRVCIPPPRPLSFLRAGTAPILKKFWGCALDTVLTAELKRKADANENSGITINTLELIGMVATCLVVQVIVRDKPNEEGRSTLMRGDKVSAVSWLNRCGGSRIGVQG